MEKLAIFEHIQTKFLDRVHAPMVKLRPIDVICERTMTMDSQGVNREYEHSIKFMVRSLIPDQGADLGDLIVKNERRVINLIAEALYKEVFADLLDIGVHVMENHYDPKLNEMISVLAHKMRP